MKGRLRDHNDCCTYGCAHVCDVCDTPDTAAERTRRVALLHEQPVAALIASAAGFLRQAWAVPDGMYRDVWEASGTAYQDSAVVVAVHLNPAVPVTDVRRQVNQAVVRLVRQYEEEDK